MLLSDGNHAILALISMRLHIAHQQVNDEYEMTSYNHKQIVQVNKQFTILKQEDRKSPILLLTALPSVIYDDISQMLGKPRLYQHPKPQQTAVCIPHSDLLKNTKLEYHSLIYCLDPQNFIPLSKLYPFIKGSWRIKVKVSRVNDVKRWYSEKKGEGKLQSLIVVDAQSTESTITMFSETLDRFEGLFKEGSVYLISNGTVKPSKQGEKGDMAIVLDRQTTVQEVHDDENEIQLKQLGIETCRFTQIQELKRLRSGTMVDVIGVVIKMGQAGMVHNPKQPKKDESIRRNAIIADDSGHTIMIGFWGDNAAPMNQVVVGQTVVAVKYAQVSEYAGRSLNCNNSHTSKLFVEPKLERTNDILKWWCLLDDDSRQELKSVSRDMPLDACPNPDLKTDVQRKKESTKFIGTSELLEKADQTQESNFNA